MKANTRTGRWWPDSARFDDKTVYEPAVDQIPMTGRDKYIRRLQDLLLRCPDDTDTRQRYYAMLAGPIPPENRGSIQQVISVNVAATQQQQRRGYHVHLWASRIVNFLYWIGYYR